jgi:hypothetical protein
LYVVFRPCFLKLCSRKFFVVTQELYAVKKICLNKQFFIFVNRIWNTLTNFIQALTVQISLKSFQQFLRSLLLQTDRWTDGQLDFYRCSSEFLTRPKLALFKRNAKHYEIYSLSYVKENLSFTYFLVLIKVVLGTDSFLL